jgi:hypothetical protein
MARHAAHLAALERDPPADLVAEVGQRPTHPVAAEAWRNSVAEIERFLAASGIDRAELERGREGSHESQGLYELSTKVDLTPPPPEQRPGIERVDGLAVDF